MSFEPGAVIPLRLVLLGPSAGAATDVLGALAQAPLARTAAGAPGSFELLSAHEIGGTGRILFSRGLNGIPLQRAPARPLLSYVKAEDSRVKALRVCWLTPFRLHTDNGYCYDPQQAAERFAAACWSRCVRLCELCCGAAARPPFRKWEPGDWWVEECHAYRYEWKRVSLRQSRGMSLDGLVGFCDLYGELGDVYALSRVAELAHVGQKTSFGLGKVRVYVLE